MIDVPADLVVIRNDFGNLAYRARVENGLFCISDEASIIINSLQKKSSIASVERLGLETGLSERVINKAIQDIQPLIDDYTEVPPSRHVSEWPNYVNNIRFFVTTKCNMDCSFCYVQDLWSNNNYSVMNFLTAKKAIDWWDSNHNVTDSVSIRFFGGEPTLEWDLILRIASYSLNTLGNKRVRLILNTNGTLIDEIRAEQLSSLNFHTIVSLDDIPGKIADSTFCQHDSAIVERNVKLLLESNCNVTISCVAGPSWRGKQFIEYLANVGVSNVGINSFRFSDNLMEQYDAEDMTDQIIEAWKYGNSAGVNVGGEWRWFLERLDSKDSHGWMHCFGLGGEISVMPDGSVYPCCGMKIRIGTVNNPSALSKSTMLAPIQDRNNYLMDYCSQCSIYRLCRGGCAADAYWQNGDLRSAHGCDVRRRFVERFLQKMEF